MKILYVNIHSTGHYYGHKKFDLEWCDNLSQFGKVDLIQPEDNWYENCRNNVNLLTFNPNKNQRKFDFWLAKLLHFFKISKTINPAIYAESKAVLNFVNKIEKTNNYDVIIASRFEIFVLTLSKISSKLMNKLFVIEHCSFQFSNNIFKAIYDRKANAINHIAMEFPIYDFLNQQIGIDSKKLFYIPHPFNEPIKEHEGIETYDIVGISNSNSLTKILEIIKYEEETNYFSKNKIKVLLRNTEYQYNNGYLKIVKGWVNYSTYDYYTLIAKAKIVLIPFTLSSITGTSGTIIDALSNRVPCIGTPTITFQWYCKEYPNVCCSYNSISDLRAAIEKLSNNNMFMEKDFNKFQNDRSKTKMHDYISNAINIQENS